MLNRIILFCSVFFMLNSVALSQPFYMFGKPPDNIQINLKYYRPSFEQDVTLSTMSGAYELTINKPLNERLNIFGMLQITIS